MSAQSTTSLTNLSDSTAWSERWPNGPTGSRASSSGAGRILHSCSTLDGDCQVNLIAFAVSRTGEDKRALQGAVEGVLSEMERGSVPLTHWDAPLTYFERGHLKSKDLIEANDSVTIYGWPIEKSRDWQRQKIAELVETCRSSK